MAIDVNLVVSYIALERSHCLCHVGCGMSRVKAPQAAGVLTGGFGGNFRDNFRELCGWGEEWTKICLIQMLEHLRDSLTKTQISDR